MAQSRQSLSARLLTVTVTVALSLSFITAHIVLAKEAICPVGVNVNSFQNFESNKQDAIVNQLKESKVEFVRTSLRMDGKNLDLAKRLQENGIGLVLVPGIRCHAGVVERPANPKYHMRAALPLSECDLDLTRQSFQDIFDKLDEKGVKLTAIELGNELNWTDFNGDFPVPARGKSLNFAELSSDPIGRKVAKGFLQYLKALKALKAVRDNSKLNRGIPIICAGMAGVTGGQWEAKSKIDGISIPATYAFLRKHGLDELVDGYGVHAYVSRIKAGDKEALEKRNKKLDEQIFPDGNGNPYWVTEWGFPSQDVSPEDDGARTRAVLEMRTYFHKLQKQGRLGGIFWYVWNEPDKCSIYRNGNIVESGLRATRQM